MHVQQEKRRGLGENFKKELVSQHVVLSFLEVVAGLECCIPFA